MKPRARIDFMKECVDYGRMEAIPILKQNPGIDQDELTRQATDKAMKRYHAVVPSDIGEADVDVACRHAEENVPEGARITNVEYMGEDEAGWPVYRFDYEM